MLPREEILGPLNRLAAKQLQQLRMPIQVGDPLRYRLWVLGGNKIAGFPVTDRELNASYVRTDDRGAAGHRLYRGNPKGLIPRRRDKDVGGIIIVFEFFTSPTSNKHHVVGDPFFFRQHPEPIELGRELHIRSLRLAAD